MAVQQPRTWTPLNSAVLRRLAPAAAVALVAIAIFILRRPDAITRPQFYAEDATVFYRQANLFGGLQALFITQGSAFQIVPRLIAAVAVHLPFAAAPLFMNICALVVQVLPIFYVMSGRMDTLVPSRWVQFGLAAIYTLLPCSHEVDANTTNIQWHLALLAFMVVVGDPPPARPRAWWLFDIAVVGLCGLTGVFASLLSVVLVLKQVFVQRDRWTRVLTAISIPLAIIQTTQVYLHPRNFPPPGLRFDTLAHVFGGSLLIGPTLGTNIYLAVWRSPIWASHTGFPPFMAALTVAICVIALWQCPWQLRVALLYALGPIFFLFINRQQSPQDGYIFSTPGLAGRYYFLFYAVWFPILVWLLLRGRRSLRVVPALLLACSVLIAVPSDFEYPPLPDYHFDKAVQAYERAPPGGLVIFDVPAGPAAQVIINKPR